MTEIPETPVEAQPEEQKEAPSDQTDSGSETKEKEE